MVRKELELPEVREHNLVPSDEQLKLIIKELARLFVLDDRINIKKNNKALEKASSIVNKSLEEWGEKSPKNFRSKLIACISAFGPRDNRVGKHGAERIVDEAITRSAPLLNMVDTCITDTERKFIKERLRKYKEEYEFNETSDEVLLRQLVSLEYLALRLEFAQRQDWREPMKYNVALQNIENRMMKLMEKLGVARFQREDDISGEATNIAELAAIYDMKKKQVKENELRDKKEAEMFIRLRREKGYDEMNIIPDSEFDILNKQMEETEKIDASKFFDVDDLDLIRILEEDFEKVDLNGGNKTEIKNTKKK